ncbi:MAG: hypothetical protein JXP34_14755, partial [Planctomycetes bacterium]|nr:hypothetical protein [Planctomycetota bacterium]
MRRTIVLLLLVARAEAAEPACPSPAELWERCRKDLAPLTFTIDDDEIVPSTSDPHAKLRRIDLRFTSQVVAGKAMDHPCVIFLPPDREALRAHGRRGKAVVVAHVYGDTSMVYNYGDPIAVRTGYPVMMIPNPGSYEGAHPERGWIEHTRDLVRKTGDPIEHNYFRLAIPYLRALDIFAEILETKEIRAVIGGHSKRATSAWTAAAMDPERIAGVVYMGNESVFSSLESGPMRPLSPYRNQRYVRASVLYVGATNEDGYEMFNINRIQARMERPWTIEYIPNYRHATNSEVQFLEWPMWVSHVFDGRPIARIDDLGTEGTKEGTIFRARIRTPNRIIQVKFWYVYCDDVPYWRDLVWYPAYGRGNRGDIHQAYAEGKTPD